MVAPRRTRVGRNSFLRSTNARGVSTFVKTQDGATDLVLNRDAGINRYVVLDLAAVTDGDPRPEHDVLAHDAVTADATADEHVREVPDLRAVADFDALVDSRRGMDECRHGAGTSTGYPPIKDR